MASQSPPLAHANRHASPVTRRILVRARPRFTGNTKLRGRSSPRTANKWPGTDPAMLGKDKGTQSVMAHVLAPSSYPCRHRVIALEDYLKPNWSNQIAAGALWGRREPPPRSGAGEAKAGRTDHASFDAQLDAGGAARGDAQAHQAVRL